MSKQSVVDRNLKVESKLAKDGIVFYNILQEPFQIHGVIPPCKEGEPFYRIPPEVAQNVNKGVIAMNPCTAGGRVRFRTDSAFVAVHVEMKSDIPLINRFPHMALTGSAGMDLYEHIDGKEHYVMTFIPPLDMEDAYESIIEFPDARPRELTINMPLYSGMTKLLVGLSEDAKLWCCRPYTHSLPVVYYGSSITQGGCASRPGNSYQSMISQRLDCDFINLGFSGWARAEESIISYISELPMGVFVFDYDHNAPTVEHLKETHNRAYQMIRARNPELPIIFLSRPHGKGLTIWISDEEVETRFQIIKKTYDDAIAQGDRNVYLIDGRKVVSQIPEAWGVDRSHPNDLGFRAIANSIGDILEKLL